MRAETEMVPAEQFGERVGQIFAEQHPVVGGRIQVLNLEPLKARHKERWPRLGEMVHQTVSKILNRRLLPQDLFTRNADDSYVIVFASLSEDEARLKCALLAREIAEKLNGDESPTAELAVQTAVATLSGHVGLEAAGALDQITETLAATQEPGDAAVTPVGSRSRPEGAPVVDQLSRLLASIEERLTVLDHEARQRGAAAVGAEWAQINELLRRAEGELADIAQTPVWSDIPGYQPDTEWIEMARMRTIQVLAKSENAAAAYWQQDASPAVEFDNPEVAFFYRPVWQARRGVVTTYTCSLRAQIGGYEVLNDLSASDEQEISLANVMDRLVVRRAVKDLMAGVEEQRLTVVIVPVHYLTVSRAAIASGFMRLIHTIPPNLRQFLVWELLDAPVGTWTTQILPALSALKRCGRAVIVRVDLETREFRDIAAMGVHAVGIEVERARDPEAILRRKIERFAAQAERAQLQCYINGVHSLPLVEAAVAAGFDYIAGAAIADTVEFPAGIVPTTMRDIYRRRLA